MAFCKIIENKKSKIKIIPKNRRCRYHRSKRDIPFFKAVPDGFCVEAFHASFPAAFAMLSTDRNLFKNGCKVICPAGMCRFELNRKPLLNILLLLRQLAHWVISFVYPIEVLWWKTSIKVLESADCPYDFKIGSEYEINVGQTDDLCPAAFNNVYPSIIKNIFNGNRPHNYQLACPDHKTNVSIEFNSNGTDLSDKPYEKICPDGNDYEIEITQTGGETSIGLVANKRYKLKDLLNKIGIPCTLLLNSLSTYYRILREGGKLGFYTGNYNSAIVQCPSTENNVITIIERLTKEEKIEIKILSNKQKCPLGIVKGEDVSIKSNRETIFWFQALAVLTPYIHNIELLKDSEVYFSLPDNVDCPTVFKIQRTVSINRGT